MTVLLPKPEQYAQSLDSRRWISPQKYHAQTFPTKITIIEQKVTSHLNGNDNYELMIISE
jgi:hypothetical protein